VIAVCVYVPQGPGRVGAELWPETFDVAAAVGVVWGTADGDFGIADYSSTIETRGTARAAVGAEV
jgi:hypothetical protein